MVINQNATLTKGVIVNAFSDSFKSFDNSVDAQRFVGRIQAEAEFFAHLVLGCSAENFRTWLGATLINPVSNATFEVEEVPTMSGRSRPKKAIERRSKALVDNQPPGAGSRKTQGKTGANQVKSYWYRMSEEQRKKEMRRRWKVRRENAKKKAA